LFARVWRRARAGAGRLRANGWSILQTALAAGLSYFLAEAVLGNEQPFFAPIAAVVTLSVSLGQRGRRAAEVALGVAVGLLVADLTVLAIGVGTPQIALVVALAMAAVVLFSDRVLLVNQAAISAILVIVLQPPEAGFSPDRFFNALIGGVVALTINYLFPANPERVVERAARPIFDELGRVLEEIARAIETRDAQRAERVLDRTRVLDESVSGFHDTLAAGRETAQYSPTRRRGLKHLDLYAGANVRMELAAINTRVLARGVTNALRRGDEIPSVIPAAVLELAAAVKELSRYLQEWEGPEGARRHALEAARGATAALEDRHNLTTSVIVGQVRSMAVDLLRSTGMNQAQALAALEEAAGRASEIG
jgi:uncharacterized membrane protein YgaE (UPF0421/DUF939 family)